MESEFSFAETYGEVLLTFYKLPKEVKEGLPSAVSPQIKLKDSTTLMFNSQKISLFAPVEVVKIENSKYKTEITLKKDTPMKWNCLNGTIEPIRVRDDIYTEEKKEEKAKDLMEMFRNIYNEGDEDVKKAMNKSLEESSGTVLSTNWKEVSSKKINPEK